MCPWFQIILHQPCLILFGEDTHATEPIIRKLDYAIPAETSFVGDQKGQFLHKRANESRTVQLHKNDSRVLAGFIFARDRHRPAQAGRIQFHTARGMSSAGLRYKAANVVVSIPRWDSTFLTAKRRGEAEVLNGEQILDVIENFHLLGNQVWENDPYLGVTKKIHNWFGAEAKDHGLTCIS